MTDIIVTLILLAIVGSAIVYIVKAKKSGAKCIGCPHGKNCPSHKQNKTSDCSCGCEKKD